MSEMRLVTLSVLRLVLSCSWGTCFVLDKYYSKMWTKIDSTHILLSIMVKQKANVKPDTLMKFAEIFITKNETRIKDCDKIDGDEINFSSL